MKIHSTIRHVLIAASLLTLAACSSTRHGSDDIGAPGSIGGEGSGGAYTEGMGGGSGFQPSTSCNVPQTSGFNTQAYYFAYDSSDVNSADINRLQSLASNIGASHSNIRVVGNTDNRGSREYNIALGWRRANAVAASLQQSGVGKQQITTNSNGAEKPIAFGTSEDDYQCNRRVDVVYK